MLVQNAGATLVFAPGLAWVTAVLMAHVTITCAFVLGCHDPEFREHLLMIEDWGHCACALFLTAITILKLWPL